jgi:hypothetical protein
LKQDVEFMPGLVWTVILLFMLAFVVGITGMLHQTQLFIGQHGAWNSNPPNLCLLTGYDYKA